MVDVESQYPELMTELRLIADEFIAEYRTLLLERSLSAALADSMTAEVIAAEKQAHIAVRLYAYWRWIEDGRGPGKQPPLESILEWVEKTELAHRAAEEGMTARQMAFLIARKIGREGTTGKRIIFDIMENRLPEWYSRLSSATTRDVRIIALNIIKTLTA